MNNMSICENQSPSLTILINLICQQMSEVPDPKRSGTKGLQKTPTQSNRSQGLLFAFNKYSYGGKVSFLKNPR